jgi:hypothetical protein
MITIAQRLHAIHADRDKNVLLCEHQVQQWGEPLYRLGKNDSSVAETYRLKTQSIRNEI